MTQRRIHYAISRINIRTHNKRAFEANLQGAKAEYTLIGESPAVPTFTPEQDALAEKAMQAAMERKRAEYRGVS